MPEPNAHLPRKICWHLTQLADILDRPADGCFEFGHRSFHYVHTPSQAHALAMSRFYIPVYHTHSPYLNASEPLIVSKRHLSRKYRLQPQRHESPVVLLVMDTLTRCMLMHSMKTGYFLGFRYNEKGFDTLWVLQMQKKCPVRAPKASSLTRL